MSDNDSRQSTAYSRQPTPDNHKPTTMNDNDSRQSTTDSRQTTPDIQLETNINDSNNRQSSTDTGQSTADTRQPTIDIQHRKNQTRQPANNINIQQQCSLKTCDIHINLQKQKMGF